MLFLFGCSSVLGTERLVCVVAETSGEPLEGVEVWSRSGSIESAIGVTDSGGYTKVRVSNPISALVVRRPDGSSESRLLSKVSGGGDSDRPLQLRVPRYSRGLPEMLRRVEGLPAIEIGRPVAGLAGADALEFEIERLSRPEVLRRFGPVPHLGGTAVTMVVYRSKAAAGEARREGREGAAHPSSLFVWVDPKGDAVDLFAGDEVALRQRGIRSRP